MKITDESPVRLDCPDTDSARSEVSSQRPASQPGTEPDAESGIREDGETDGHDPVGPAVSPGPSDPSGLSERECLILAFERRWWRYAGVKEQAIRETFGLSPTRYYQALNALLDRPEALASEPVLVNRLRRLRVARQRARSGRRAGMGA